MKYSLKVFATVSGSKIVFPSLLSIKFVTVFAPLPLMSFSVCQRSFGFVEVLYSWNRLGFLISLSNFSLCFSKYCIVEYLKIFYTDLSFPSL